MLSTLDRRFAVTQEYQAREYKLETIESVLNYTIGEDPNGCFTYSHTMGGITHDLKDALDCAMSDFVSKYS